MQLDICKSGTENYNEMKRACLKLNINTDGKNPGSISPLKINFLRIKKILFFLPVILLLGCTERIDIEVDESFARIMVEGYLSTDATNHMVKISKSADFFNGTEIPMVSGATVYIKWNEDSVMLTEAEPGYYFTPGWFRGVENYVYELVIEDVDIDNDGNSEVYRARDKMQKIVPMDSIRLSTTTVGFQERKFLRVHLFAQDPPEKNFYIFKAFRNGKLLDESLTDWNLTDDQLFNGNYVKGVDVKWIDQVDSLLIVNPGDTLTLEMANISDKYVEFLNGAYNESFGSIPLFSGPPANIKSNVDNGGLGYFAAWAVSRSSVIFIDEVPSE